MFDFHPTDEFWEALNRLTETFEHVGLVLKDLASRIEALGLSLAIDSSTRYNGEHPVDYVLRIGPSSGYTIHEDEAWRYRSYPLDWWNFESDPLDDLPATRLGG